MKAIIMANQFKVSSIATGRPQGWREFLAVGLAFVLTGCMSDEKLLRRLAPNNETMVIVETLGATEDISPTHPARAEIVAAVKPLVIDTRELVRRKAARALGLMHAEVDQNDIKNICVLLKANDVKEVIDGLKALRDLNPSGVEPAVLACLTHSNHHVVQDACRTLAVIGGKGTIASIEPLLKSPDSDIRGDAEDALEILRAKP